jgi:hypothetical protein
MKTPNATIESPPGNFAILARETDFRQVRLERVVGKAVTRLFDVSDGGLRLRVQSAPYPSERSAPV